MFLVRKGNPKEIKDWDDLVQPGVSVITPNPKTSGGARWNYLAAWGYGLKAVGSDEAKAQRVRQRSSSRTCRCSTPARAARRRRSSQRGIGDVLIAWENEALPRASRSSGKDQFEIVVPSLSILAEPPVAVVDKVVDKRGTRDGRRGVSGVPVHAGGAGDRREALLSAAPSRSWRSTPAVSRSSSSSTIDERSAAGQKAQTKHFDDSGVFDQI